MHRLSAIVPLGCLILAGVGACDDDDPTGVQSTTYVAAMNGANERPNPVTTSATGTATFVLSGNTLTYTITVNGMSAAISGAHIHVGDAQTAGGIIFNLNPANVQTGTLATGSINLSAPIVAGASSISGDSLRVLLNTSRAYTNVHTTNFPGGEIRGQIVKQ